MHNPLFHRRLLLATLIAGLFHNSAVAEETAIPSIDVEAQAITEKASLNTSVLSVKELKSMAPSTSDTASLLKNVPGLVIQKSGGVSGLPVLRGMADDRLRIKVDGMSLISACGNHMNPALSYISPTNVGSAVVHSSLSPVSSGGDSIGGTILIDSPAPQFAKAGEELLTTGEIGGFYRSNGDVRGGNISVTGASEIFSINYQGSTVKSDNYDAGGNFKPDSMDDGTLGRSSLDGDEVGSTFYKSTNQSIGLAMQYENHLLEFTYGEQDIPYQAWVNQRMDMTGNDSEQYNLNYTGEFDWGKLEAQAYKERTRHSMQFDDDKQYWYAGNQPNKFPPVTPCEPAMMTCAAGMPMDTKGKNTGGIVKADIPLSSQDMLKIGAELQNYTLDDWWDASGGGMWPDTFVNINNGQRDRTALFAEWEADWNPQWQTMLGIRGEKVDMDADEVQGYTARYNADATAFNNADRDITDHNIDVTALAQFTMDEMTNIEFGYAQKTRSPNLYERYAWSTGNMAMIMVNWSGDGNGYVGNLELDPEISHNFSVTFDLHDSNQSEWGLQVTPYYSYIDDYIDAERLPTSQKPSNATSDEFVYLQFVNQDSHIYGIDISGFYPIAKHTDYGSFTATGLINYTYGKNEDTNDYLYNMMPLNARLALVQNFGQWTNTLEWEVVDNKSNVSETRNELETSGYALLHLRSSYEWKDIRIDVGVENVFDRLYDHPLGGAYLGEGQTMNTGPTGVAWGTSAPGMGRSVYAGFNYQF